MTARLLVGALLLALAALSWRLWMSDSGMREVWRLDRAVHEQAEQNAVLRTRNQELDAEVADLKVGLEAIEERARQELGMTARGETFVQVVEGDEAADASPPNE